MSVTSTMMDAPLLVTDLVEHGNRVHGDREIVTWLGERARRVSFAETHERALRLASALADLGVGVGDVVGTFCWNSQEHVEAYFAVPGIGAVLHQLNIRLSAGQLAFVIEDLGDRLVIVDDSLVDTLAACLDRAPSPRVFVVVGDGDSGALERHGRVIRYDELLALHEPLDAWPELDERSAAAACHTSGTTGDPKGVVYSHRSIWTHTFGLIAGGIDPGPGDRLLLVVPQFHANAWGLVHACWIRGVDLLLPGPHLAAEPLTAFIAAQRPTCGAAVPTVWNGVLRLGEERDIDLSSMRWVNVGGAAVPASMIASFSARHDVDVIQGWGMTEMSPVGAVAIPPAGADPARAREFRGRTGRVVPGVQIRVVAEDGSTLPWDGESIGEYEVRGPWISGRYHGIEAPEKFHDGWLRTGDVGVIDQQGFLQIVDRTKDVIKSGGEWISSVDLENALMDHPDVVECAVIAVPDERWDERPLACVVLRGGSPASFAQLDTHLRERVPKWWAPERYVVVEQVPRTSVGKFDKKLLRARYDAGDLEVVRVPR